MGDEHIATIVHYSEYLSRYTCQYCGTRDNVGEIIGMHKTVCQKEWLNYNISNDWECVDTGMWWKKCPEDGKIKEYYYANDGDEKFTGVEIECEFNVFERN